LLGPGMQDGEQANRRADVARVAGKFADGLRGYLHQKGLAVTLVGVRRVAEFLGRGHGDVEIAVGRISLSRASSQRSVRRL
jgi:hypothetical protein